MAYDTAGRLMSVTIGASVATMLPDALGRIRSRTAGGVTDTYRYEGTSEAIVAIEGGASIRRSVIDAAGTRLATRDGTTTGFLVPDPHGNTGAVLAETTATIINALRYDAYGQLVDEYADPTSPLPNVDWRYQGRLDLSPSTSDPIYEFSAREYAPALGTFTSLDSYAGQAVDPISMNRFLYAHANPATLIDPTGHAPQLCFDECDGNYSDQGISGSTPTGQGNSNTWSTGPGNTANNQPPPTDKKKAGGAAPPLKKVVAPTEGDDWATFDDGGYVDRAALWRNERDRQRENFGEYIRSPLYHYENGCGLRPFECADARNQATCADGVEGCIAGFAGLLASMFVDRLGRSRLLDGPADSTAVSWLRTTLTADDFARNVDLIPGGSVVAIGRRTDIDGLVREDPSLRRFDWQPVRSTWDADVNLALVTAALERRVVFRVVSEERPEYLVNQTGSRAGQPTPYGSEMIWLNELAKNYGYVRVGKEFLPPPPGH